MARPLMRKPRLVGRGFSVRVDTNGTCQDAEAAVAETEMINKVSPVPNTEE